MALINIKLPTGWTAIEESLINLKTTVDLKRYEINDIQIVLYFDEV